MWNKLNISSIFNSKNIFPIWMDYLVAICQMLANYAIELK